MSNKPVNSVFRALWLATKARYTGDFFSAISAAESPVVYTGDLKLPQNRQSKRAIKVPMKWKSIKLQNLNHRVFL